MINYSATQERVLLLAPNFFGYEKEIKSELEQMGYIVDLVDVRPTNSPLGKGVLRLRPQYLRYLSKKYYARLLTEYGDRGYSLVLVIKGEGLFPETVKQMRRVFPNARFVLYSYDSVRNAASFLDIYKIFDKALSFDIQDSQKIVGLFHEPLFYIRKYQDMPPLDVSRPSYDVSFVGSLHADRFSVVQGIISSLPKGTHTFTFFYYASTWIFKALQLVKDDFRKTPLRAVSFKSLPQQRVAEIFQQSRCVIDVQHPSQTGLTMRTFELLGARKKVITTNKAILDYDIYNSRNFCVIDRNYPEVPEEFLISEYQDYSPELYQKYALREWLLRVIR